MILNHAFKFGRDSAEIKLYLAHRMQVLKHPAYSPDLAPSDYHLFAPLKDALQDRKLSSDEAVQKVVHEWLCDQPKTFFSDGIHKLVGCWNKCIKMGGNYVEK